MQNNSFSGYESDSYIPTAIIGAEKGNEWIEHLLSYYEDKSFYNEDGSLDLTTNVITISTMTKDKYKVKLDGNLLKVNGVFTIYPKDYFCPVNLEANEVKITDNTVAIHHFNASWCKPIEIKIRNIRRTFLEKYGKDEGIKKFDKWYSHRKLFLNIQRYGFKKTYISIIKRIKGLFKKES